MENLFMALADRTRLRLLNLMNEGEICVCYFTEVLQEGQPKISRHLAYLRRSGLVETRRQGKWIYYRQTILKDNNAQNILEAVRDWSKADKQMQSDSERFNQIYGQPEEMPIAIQHVSLNPNMQIEKVSDKPIVNQKETLADFLL